MVKAEDVVLSASAADFEIKFDEDADLFNPAGYDLPQINWCDDTPPDTPCPSNTSVISHPPVCSDVFFFVVWQTVVNWLENNMCEKRLLSLFVKWHSHTKPSSSHLQPLVDGILESLTKVTPHMPKGCDDWDYVEMERPSTSSCTSTGPNSPSSSSGASIMWNMDTDPAFKLVASAPPGNVSGLDLSREALTASLDLFANEDTSDDDIFREFPGMKRKAISW